MSIFSGLFWGIFLMAAGLIVLLKLVFNLQVSVGKLIFGMFVLLIGVSLLTNSFQWGNFKFNSANTTVFAGSSDEIVVKDSNDDYSVVFGSVTYDASQLQPGQSVKIRCAFGSCKVLLPKGNVYVTATSAFGSIHLPGGKSVTFSSDTYGTDGTNAIRIDISCAFGSVTVVESN